MVYIYTSGITWNGIADVANGSGGYNGLSYLIIRKAFRNVTESNDCTILVTERQNYQGRAQHIRKWIYVCNAMQLHHLSRIRGMYVAIGLKSRREGFVPYVNLGSTDDYTLHKKEVIVSTIHRVTTILPNTRFAVGAVQTFRFRLLLWQSNVNICHCQHRTEHRFQRSRKYMQNRYVTQFITRPAYLRQSSRRLAAIK